MQLYPGMWHSLLMKIFIFPTAWMFFLLQACFGSSCWWNDWRESSCFCTPQECSWCSWARGSQNWPRRIYSNRWPHQGEGIFSLISYCGCRKCAEALTDLRCDFSLPVRMVWCYMFSDGRKYKWSFTVGSGPAFLPVSRFWTYFVD